MRITAPSVLTSGAALPGTAWGLNSVASPKDFGGRDEVCCNIATSAVDEPSNRGTTAGVASRDD